MRKRRGFSGETSDTMIVPSKRLKATTLRLEEQDIKALETIKQHYGIASDNQVIILAIHVTVKQIEGGAPAAAFHPHS